MKQKYKEVISKIRFILLNDWDPIGISPNINLFDEYDGYISLILRMLLNGTDEKELSSILYKIEQDIGIDRNIIYSNKAAHELIKLIPVLRVLQSKDR
jgi:hypothetical protein